MIKEKLLFGYECEACGDTSSSSDSEPGACDDDKDHAYKAIKIAKYECSFMPCNHKVEQDKMPELVSFPCPYCNETIQFTIDGVRCLAIKGMTWEEYANDPFFNSYGLSINYYNEVGKEIGYDGTWLKVNGVKKNETIQAEGIYDIGGE